MAQTTCFRHRYSNFSSAFMRDSQLFNNLVSKCFALIKSAQHLVLQIFNLTKQRKYYEYAFTKDS